MVSTLRKTTSLSFVAFSVFAPEVRAAIPVSEKRLDAKWSEALGE